MGSSQNFGLSTEFDGDASLSGKRILLAEDEGLIALEIECCIQDHGGEVVGPFATLSDVMKAAEDQTLDGAILDIMLGTEEVYPAADRLAQRNIPVVFHSGHATEDRIATDYPGARLCQKPALPEAILAALKG